jgi:hypothetical protein
MDNKMRVIDINIVSAYMGRFLTVIVMLTVLAITLSAIVSGDGFDGHRNIIVGVPQKNGSGEIGDGGAALRQLVAGETGQPVSIRSRGTEWDDDCDLYLMDAREFVEERLKRELVALCSVGRKQGGSDAALLISRRGSTVPAAPRREDVIFLGPRSINGCWLQLAFLESSGFEAPEKIGNLSFAPSPGAGARTVFSVLFGEFLLGACRASDMAVLVEAGEIDENELVVVKSLPALPETVLACRARDAGYFEAVFNNIAVTLAFPGVRDRAAVYRLRSSGFRSLRPVTADEIDRLLRLFDAMEERL